MVHRKQLVFLFLFLFLISFTSAITYKVGEPLDLTVSCDGYTCSTVNLTVLNPNSSILVNNQPMANKVFYANYTLTPLTNGDYIYYYTDGGNISSQQTFSANGSGIPFTSATSIFYIAILGLLIFFFVLNYIGISRLPTGNPKGEDGNIISVNWFKYAKTTLMVIEWGLLVTILFITSALSSAYLESGFYDIFFMLFKVSTFLIVPVLVLYFFWLVINIIHDKKLKKLLQQGIPTTW